MIHICVSESRGCTEEQWVGFWSGKPKQWPLGLTAVSLCRQTTHSFSPAFSSLLCVKLEWITWSGNFVPKSWLQRKMKRGFQDFPKSKFIGSNALSSLGYLAPVLFLVLKCHENVVTVDGFLFKWPHLVRYKCGYMILVPDCLSYFTKVWLRVNSQRRGSQICPVLTVHTLWLQACLYTWQVFLEAQKTTVFALFIN